MKRGRSSDGEVDTLRHRDDPIIDAASLSMRMREIYEECSKLRQEYFDSLAEGMWVYHGRERFLKTKVREEIERRADEYHLKMLEERVYYIPKEMVIISDTSGVVDN